MIDLHPMLVILYRTFLRGLLTVIPVGITVYILVWFVRSAEQLFGAPLMAVLPEHLRIPGLGFLLFLVVILLIGALVESYLTSRLLLWLERRFERIPFVKTIYNPLRDVMNLFSQDDKRAQKRVVLVQLENGISMLGLMTRDQFGDLPEGAVPLRHVAVYIPLSYALGGMTVLVDRDKVREMPLSAEKAMQLAITAWIKSTPK